MITRAERELVLELVAAGKSRRAVAREVFGDERLKGRVDRIIARASQKGRTYEGNLADDPGSSDDVPTLEELVLKYGRRLRRRLDDPDGRVTAGELEAYARLQFRLENMRTIERLNRLTREG